jgi:hypothetical protein
MITIPTPMIPNKNTNKALIGFVAAGFFFIICIAHADGLIINYSRDPERPIVGVVSFLGDNDFSIIAQSGSTAAISSSTIEAGKTKVLRSDATALVRSVQINGKILAISAVSSANKTAKVISDAILPFVRGPPHSIMAA